MDEFVTIETILTAFEKWVMERSEISPDLWMQGALKLNVLIGNEYDKAAELEQKCAIIEAAQIEQGSTSARAKNAVKIEQVWLDLQKQKARIKMVEEFIKLAKKHAQIINDQMRNML